MNSFIQRGLCSAVGNTTGLSQDRDKILANHSLPGRVRAWI